MKMKNKILITGGSGFIGTQVSGELSKNGFDVTVVDRKINFKHKKCKYFLADFLDFLEETTLTFDTIIHLAAEHQVEKSISEPDMYYENNIVKMKAMLDIMVRKKIKNIIFSSSGAVYGKQANDKISLLPETLCYDSTSTYASTKVAGELLIKDYARAYGINYVIFRYFNAAGADPSNNFGYIQEPATHVIPILCKKIINQEVFKIYGSDYDTVDGTCIRDYVHAKDLAKAHQKAIEFLNRGNKNEIFNLGSGTGISVKQLIDTIGIVLDKSPVFEYNDRRPGDSPSLVADTTKANQLLGWKPVYTINDIISHAWKWEKKYSKIKKDKEQDIIAELLTLTCEIDEWDNKYYKNKEGEYHRIHGPAIIYSDGEENWFNNDEFHREDGPAVTWPGGRRDYYINGNYVTEEEYIQWQKDNGKYYCK